METRAFLGGFDGALLGPPEHLRVLGAAFDTAQPRSCLLVGFVLLGEGTEA